MIESDIIKCSECNNEIEYGKLKHIYGDEYDQKDCPHCHTILENCITGDEYFWKVG